MLFIAAMIWGSLSAQFLVQTITCFIIGIVCVSGLMFSQVSRVLNAIGTLVAIVQTLVFLGLFLGGDWIVSSYIDYESWNANSIASSLAFLATLVYCGAQVPGKILLARLCVWSHTSRRLQTFTRVASE